MMILFGEYNTSTSCDHLNGLCMHVQYMGYLELELERIDEYLIVIKSRAKDFGQYFIPEIIMVL